MPCISEEETKLLAISGKLIDFGFGLLDVSVASYNHLIRFDLPRMINAAVAILDGIATAG